MTGTERAIVIIICAFFGFMAALVLSSPQGDLQCPMNRS